MSLRIPFPQDNALRSRPPSNPAWLRRRSIKLTFRAAGTHATRPPPARGYLIKQSRRPIRTARDFRRADTLCKGTCTFNIDQVGERVTLTVTDLRPRTTYHYAIAARDNVSHRTGPRSKTVKQRLR